MENEKKEDIFAVGEIEEDINLEQEEIVEKKEPEELEETEEEKSEKLDQEKAAEDETEKTEEELEAEKLEAEKEKDETEEEKLAREKLEAENKEKEKSATKDKPKDIKKEDIFDVPEIIPEETSGKINYKTFAKSKFDVEIEDNSEDALVTAINKKIADASEKTVLDLSKYNEEQKQLIHAMEAGNQNEFLDPVANLNDYLLEPDEDKVAVWLKFEEKVPEAEIRGRIDDMIENGTFGEKVKHILGEISETKKIIQKEVIDKARSRSEKLKETKIAEQRELLSAVDGIDKFMGKKLPESAKEYLRTTIKTGSFVKSNNNAETQMKARLFDLFGDKIMKEHQESLKEAKRKSFNDGSKKETDKLSEKPGSPESKSISDTTIKNDEESPLSEFANIDGEAIDVFEQ